MARELMTRWLPLAAVVGLWWAGAAVPARAATDPAQAEVHSGSELAEGAGHDAAAADHGSADHAGAGGHGGHAAADSRPVDPDLLLYTVAVFLLLLAILGKFAWKPIIEAVDRRERQVADQLAAAQAAQEQAQRQLAEHQAKLAGATEEIRQMLDQARREADHQKQQIVASAQQAAADEKKRAVGEITAAKNAALRELAERSVDSALGLAGKIVRRQLQPGDHAELVQEALREFPSQN
ncbi:MAG: F0F1 ATP synthase subunit B [Pirellulales bacterium]